MNAYPFGCDAMQHRDSTEPDEMTAIVSTNAFWDAGFGDEAMKIADMFAQGRRETLREWRHRMPTEFPCRLEMETGTDTFAIDEETTRDLSTIEMANELAQMEMRQIRRFGARRGRRGNGVRLRDRKPSTDRRKERPRP